MKRGFHALAPIGMSKDRRGGGFGCGVLLCLTFTCTKPVLYGNASFGAGDKTGGGIVGRKGAVVI